MASEKSDRFVFAVLGRLCEERQALGWSQEKLAEVSGIDLGVISRAERRQRIPGMASIMDMAVALDLDFADLVREAGKSVEA